MAAPRDGSRPRSFLGATYPWSPFGEGFTRAELMTNPLARCGLQGYIFQTGQPAEVRAAFLAAMGFSEAEAAADPRPFDPLAPAAR